ncbi:hypothetical protein ACQ1RB_03060 [Ornithobacterium rhinotracheale]
MKKIKFLSLVLVALSAILFTSCSKDDDGGGKNDPYKKLYGEWELYQEIKNNTVIDYNNCIPTYTFYEGNTYLFIDKEDTDEGCKSTAEKGTFKASEKSFVLIDDDEHDPVTYDIVKLDDKYMETILRYKSGGFDVELRGKYRKK